MAAIKNSLMKSSSPQTLSCILRQQFTLKTNLGNFSFALINFVYLSTTFFIQRSLTFFYFSHKKLVFNVFYSLGSRFLTSMEILVGEKNFSPPISAPGLRLCIGLRVDTILFVYFL